MVESNEQRNANLARCYSLLLFGQLSLFSRKVAATVPAIIPVALNNGTDKLRDQLKSLLFAIFRIFP